jgi:glycogen debranching enzyme
MDDASERNEHPPDEYHISSSSRRLDLRTRVLKHADSFVVLDRQGDVEDSGPTELGLFHQDTRFLSRLALRISVPGFPPQLPLLLSSAVKDDNAILFVHLTNPAMEREGGQGVQQGALHLMRKLVLCDASLCDRLRIHNYGDEPVRWILHVQFGADFADIFEARGMHRERRGQLLPPRVEQGMLMLAYQGLDERLRRTRICFETLPASLSAERGAAFELDLPPRGALTLCWTVSCESEMAQEQGSLSYVVSAPARTLWYDQAVEQRRAELQEARAAEPQLATSNSLFDEWINRSLADLHMLSTETPHGRYPYAGVPWFSTPFGRDGIITALQCLWFSSKLARGVLRYLSATQASEVNDAQDAQPGKILHETRGGEMAATGEVPFGRYYGSIDSTPLFLMLGGAYLERTADVKLVRELWPHFERALQWIDHYGDCDADGFVEYVRQTERGLANQGWKDSHDAVFHEDGTLAEAPIALAEVQGYVYAAKLGAAEMARALGMKGRGAALEEQALELQRRFEQAFWCEELGTYALALDGNKRPCRVSTSNAGQVLYSGIASAERARRVVEALMSEPGFSGWGVRTVASTAARYNPMSYHDGSVWPHDNSLVAAGLGHYGHRADAARILGGLFDASLHFDLHRLPELFCGFGRYAGESPTLYPQACSPQAWAAGTPLLCLQACLGLQVHAGEGRVYLRNPAIPAFLQQICIRGLQLPQGRMDIEVTRHDGDVGVRLMRREGQAELSVSM